MKTIMLTRGYEAMVDDEDYEMLVAYKWTASVAHRSKKVYAVHYLRSKSEVNKHGQKRVKAIPMHRMVIGAADGRWIDHADGNSLNNQRGNLRYASRSENYRNSGPRNTISGYKGVYGKRGVELFTVLISTDDGMLRVKKKFVSKEDAAREYDRLALKYHGKFARLNYPIK